MPSEDVLALNPQYVTELRTLEKRARSKYSAQKTTLDGQTFHSLLEARRYAYLEMRQKAGEITDLRTQVKYPLDVDGVHIADYIADFVYVEDEQEIVEDTKSPPTRKMAKYRLKKNLMLALYGIEIREVMKDDF